MASNPEQDLDSVESGEEVAAPRGPTFVDWGLLLLVAASRHVWVVALVFVLGTAVAFAYYKTKMPLYRVQTRVLAQTGMAAPSQVQRSIVEQDATRGAHELIRRRDNLLTLIEQTGLAKKERHEKLPLRSSGQAAGADDPLNVLVEVLGRALFVETQGNTITIGVDWPNPQEGVAIVQAAQQNFLEARHVQEISVLGEAITLLQARAEGLRKELDETVAQVEREAARPGARRAAAVVRTPGADEELVRLRSAMEAKQRAVADLEDLRRRRLAELQQQLDQMKTMYADSFPAVVSLRHQIESLGSPSPQLVALHAEEEQLRRSYNKRVEERRRTSTDGSPSSEFRVASTTDDDERVREIRGRYEQMLGRVTSAQVDLDAASAAFKHRYKIIEPAQVPKYRYSPSARKILGAGALASLLLGLLVAAGPDVLRRKVLMRWQLERGAGLPILATLKAMPVQPRAKTRA